MDTRLRPKLAFRRVEAELVDQPRTGRALVPNLFELDLARSDYEAWIDELQAQIDMGYHPGPIEICPAPKGGGMVRPGSRLGLQDRVVYTALVGACLRHIADAVRWSQDKVDFATPLNPNGLSKREWLRSPFHGWEGYRTKSLDSLAQKQTNFVLTADIAGYFENISLSRLGSELGRIACPPDVIQLIGRLLNHWAQSEGRGLPQGVLASDVLAKLYLESFDQALKAEGFRHVRYTDDIRVFCRSPREARRALVLTTALLRSRGLTLQSAKTRIRPADGLTEEFDGAFPFIRDLNRSYINKAKAAGLMAADPSLPVSVIDELIRRSPKRVNPVVIRQAFRKYVRKAEVPNRSLLHYVLRRMTTNGDHTAVEYAGDLLFSMPEETNEVVSYFAGLGLPATLEVKMAAALRSQDLAVYDYQRFLLLSCFWRDAESLRAPTRKVIRRIARDGDAAQYVRIMAWALLGKFGDQSDIERINSEFAAATDPLVRAQFLCCLQRLEKGRRNALLGRVRDEQPWVGRAVRLVRAEATQR